MWLAVWSATERHTDHSKSITKALEFRIPIYSCKDVAHKFKGVIPLKKEKKYRIGSFIVQPIAVRHSVENYAYLIEHPKMGRMIFATDLCEFPYKIQHINHWAIEANYDKDIIFDRMYYHQINQSQSNTHLSIAQCTEILKRNANQDTKTIILIHLSDANSNEQMFVEQIEREVGIRPYVAQPNMEIELNKEYF